jgi:hypothetical protein
MPLEWHEPCRCLDITSHEATVPSTYFPIQHSLIIILKWNLYALLLEGLETVDQLQANSSCGRALNESEAPEKWQKVEVLHFVLRLAKINRETKNYSDMFVQTIPPLPKVICNEHLNTFWMNLYQFEVSDVLFITLASSVHVIEEFKSFEGILCSGKSQHRASCSSPLLLSHHPLHHSLCLIECTVSLQRQPG